MIVLSSFLGGLAFGNYFIGRKVDKSKNPVRFYALLELAIGVYCLFYPIFSDFLGDIFYTSASHLNVESDSILFILLRLLFSSILLFIPTFAMGGTLPVLSKFFVDKISTAQKNVGWLYFLNSLGAVFGVILTGFFLIKTYGLDTTIYSAAIVNIGLGLIALLLSKYIKIGHINSEIEIEITNRNNDEFITPNIVKLAIVSSGISGMAALLYETLWVRLLISFLGSSTYAFSIMLAAFIAGIAIGSFIVSKKFVNKFNRIKLLIFSQLAIAVGVVLSLLIYERLPYYFWIIASWLEKTNTTFNIFLSIEFFICFALMFIPTIFMGITLPTIVDIVASSDKKIGFSVGKVFSVNTLGTVIGVFATTLVFLPLFGIKESFQIGILLNLIVALILVHSYDPIWVVHKNIISYSSIILFFLYFIFSPAWNITALNSGVFRKLSERLPQTYAEFEELFSGREILYYKEGIHANVAVAEKESENERLLIINGKVDATSSADMGTQKMIGQIPMMLHKNPKKVFVVGFGSGATIGSVLLHPVDQVKCVEISTEVIEAGKFFNDVNMNCLADPRLEVIHEDAHTYLNLSKDKYDVIISEPSNPWIAGIGNLFSQEYFQQCANKLSDDGVMAQWLHVYEASDEVVQLVINTFSSVFPHVQVWGASAADLLILGSNKKNILDENEFKNKFNIETIKQDFESIGIGSPFTFLSAQILSDQGTFLMAREKPINSEKHPILEFLAPRSLFINDYSYEIYENDEKFDTLKKGLYIKNYIKENIPSKETILGAAIYHRKETQNYRFCYGLTKYLESESLNNLDSDLLGALTFKDFNLNNVRTVMQEKLMDKYPESLIVQQEYLNSKLSETTTASTFLKIFSMKDLAKEFIKVSSSDTDALPYVYLQVAEGLLSNSEIISALIVSIELEKWLKRNPKVIMTFPMDRYYYTYAFALYHLNYMQKYSIIYSQLLQNHPNSPLLHLLKRGAEWNERVNK